MSDDGKRTKNESPEEDAKSSDEKPAAGPHDKPDLTNEDATPGTGSLPSRGKGGDADSGIG